MNDLHNVASAVFSAVISTAVGVGLGIAAYFGQAEDTALSAEASPSESLEASRRVRDLAQECATRAAEIDAQIHEQPRRVRFTDTTSFTLSPDVLPPLDAPSED